MELQVALFPLFASLNKKVKIHLLTKGNFGSAGFCSHGDCHKQTDEGRVVWDPHGEYFSCRPPHLQTSWLDWHAPPPSSFTHCLALFPSSLLPFSKSLPVTEESWQNGRKRAQTGQGRMWCQRPQTIKGAKVLPSLNCSSSVKWEPKLSTSFSEQSRLVCSTAHIRALGWLRWRTARERQSRGTKCLNFCLSNTWEKGIPVLGQCFVVTALRNQYEKIDWVDWGKADTHPVPSTTSYSNHIS